MRYINYPQYRKVLRYRITYLNIMLKHKCPRPEIEAIGVFMRHYTLKRYT